MWVIIKNTDIKNLYVRFALIQIFKRNRKIKMDSLLCPLTVISKQIFHVIPCNSTQIYIHMQYPFFSYNYHFLLLPKL